MNTRLFSLVILASAFVVGCGGGDPEPAADAPAANEAAPADEAGSPAEDAGAAVDAEPPKIHCPMIAVDMLADDTFSSLSIMSEDNCGPAKVFCSRPIRSRCNNLSVDMFERPTVSQDRVAPEELGLRPGTYCFSCVAADSSLSDENGDPIYDEEIANGILDENSTYLYQDNDGNWKSGQPSDPGTGLLYSSSRISRVSSSCLVQVNVVS